MVLGWLNKTPTKSPVFVANRVRNILSRVSAEHWSYVATDANPTDYASRGLLPRDLIKKELWWQGPPWLKQPSDQWPRRPDINLERELPELPSMVLVLQTTGNPIWRRYSSFDRLLRTMAWCRRFANNALQRDKEMSPRLTPKELETSRITRLQVCQYQTFPNVLETLRKGKELPSRFSLLSLRPFLDEKGMLRVGGCLKNTGLEFRSVHPLILSRKSPITRLLVEQIHFHANHAGPSTMLSLLAEQFYIPGVKKLVRTISRACVICQKTYAKTAGQMMGQLPADRVKPAPPFSAVGLNFAGPLWCKRGNPRKPTLVKAYACLYICFITKAVHIELVSDLTSETFLASLYRFSARRGCPMKVYSDNGSNFVGVQRELQELYQLLQQKKTQDRIHHWASERQIEWHFSPSRAPHFGGLWEAGVKSMKRLLRKVVGTHRLTFEELTTVLAEAEATMNSRPLLPMDSTPDDGVPALTPGHFLIGRPLKAPSVKVDNTSKESTLTRWNLHLQERTRWKNTQQNLKPGDVVLLKEVDTNRRLWPLARIIKTYPGEDGLTRVADIFCAGKTYKRPIHKLVLLVSEEEPPDHLQGGGCSGFQALSKD